MNWNKIIKILGLEDKTLQANIINPIRKPINGDVDIYSKGKVIGFKPGTLGGGHKYKKGKLKSFDSLDFKWLKKPKVLVLYSIFDWGGKQHIDWIDVDNCTFELIEILEGVEIV